MKRIRFIALALAAAFAISAVAVASASAALPEWRKGGSPLAGKVEFKATSGAGELETKGGSKVKCTSDEASGTIEGAKAASNVKVTFKGCESSGAKCTTKNLVAGEITTAAVLSGELKYVSEPEKRVGLLLIPPENAKGEKEFSTFACAGGFVTVTVRGEVIGEAKPVNTPKATGELIYKQTKGKQEFVQGAGKEEHLESKVGAFGAFEESGLQSEDTIEWQPPGTEVEIKA
jgi:hypothetical protein